MNNRQDQLNRFRPLESPQEKVAALRPDMAQDEELPPFRHWVASDYPREEFRRDGLWIVLGATAAFWLAVGIGIWQHWQEITAWL